MEEVTLRLNEPIFRLNWMIETFLIPTEKEIVLKSKDFSPSGSNDVWFIEVNGSSEDVRISLRLKCRGDCKDEQLKVKIGQRYEYNHDRQTDDLQYYTYTSSRSEPCPVFHLINDTVKTNLKICYTIVYEPTQPSQGGSIAEDCKQLNSISTELPTDFTLIGSDGQVRTHKFLLALRSEVFRAMFRTNMTEIRDNELQLTDFDVNTLEQLVNFLSTDKADDLANCAADLFLLADKYKITGLQSVSEQYLAQSATIESSARLLAMVQHVPSKIIMRRLVDLYGH